MVTFSIINWTNGPWKQTFVAAIACSSQIWIGGGFVSMFRMPGVSTELYGWLVSCSQFIELMTIMPGVWMSSLLGKKAVLQIAAIPSIAAYVLLSQADHILDLFLARILQGASSGLVAGVLPLYLTDIAKEGTRGGMNHILISMWYLGVAVIYSTSPFSIPVMPLTMLLLSLTLIWSLLMCWVPESPWYYVERGREAKALDSLTWLRGSQDLARREYDNAVSDRVQASWKELISKQTAVISILGILHWSFIPSWIAYSYDTFYSLTENENAALGIQLGQALLCFFVSIGSLCLLASTTRRGLLITSLAVAFLTSIAPSAYLFYYSRLASPNYVYTTPIVITLIVLYPILSSLTFQPMTYTLSIEILYRDKHRKVSIYLAHLAAALTSLSCTIVPILINSDNNYINFSILSAIIFISLICVFIILPETKDKHIFEINRLFRR